MNKIIYFIISLVLIGVSIYVSFEYLRLYRKDKECNSKSNYNIQYSIKDYLKGFGEDYLYLKDFEDVKSEGSIVFNNDIKYIKNNINKLNNPKIYACFTESSVNTKLHPKLYQINKYVLNKEILSSNLYKFMLNKCKIVNFFTGGLIEQWKNLMVCLRKLNLDKLVIVFPLDKVSLEAVKQERVNYDISLMKNELDIIKTENFGNFKNITCNKVLAISKILKKGQFVFYLDTDIVVNDNFIKDYFTLSPKHIYMQNDEPTFNKTSTNHCSGVMFIAPTNKMINIMDKSYNKILNVKSGGLTDQKILNEDIPKNLIGTLCPYKYPNGWRYFTSKIKIKNPLLIHNNWIVGVKAKNKRFKDNNMWYIG